MSYVHFLDVFDPAGLPAGLSDREAAEQARQKQLTEPSPRLLALLTRIRQQPPGMTVNVLSVAWIDGDPPRVEGEGANCALWTLVLPVDEDFDTESLEDVVPVIAHWAQELGLRVFDEDADKWPNTHPGPDPVQEPPAPPSATAGTAVSIYLNHYVWASYFRVGKRQDVPGLQAIGDELMLMDTFPDPGLADRCLAWRGRLIHRLMQELPWETHGSDLWLDGDPAQRHRDWAGPGFELRVPGHRLDEVMRVLMPLVKQLRAHVMVPSRQFWFTFWNSASPGAEAQLKDWYPGWQVPPMDNEARRAILIQGLAARLEPLGFELEEGPRSRFRFTRPLKLGGGYQMVSAAGVPFHLTLKVTSARMLHMRVQEGRAAANAPLRGDEPAGLVVDHDMQPVSTYPFDTIGYEEDAAWYFEEFERLFLPALEHLQTARAVYEWYWDEKWEKVSTGRWLWMSIYAARYLPDAAFFPIVDEFMSKYQTDNPNHATGRFLRAQPQYVGEQV
jgi:hypothetical protein